MKTVLIHNPVAGTGVSEQVFRVALERLESEGMSIGYRPTTLTDTTADIARQAVDEGAEVILVAGGDGTVSAAANVLAHTGVALGVVPVGTGNVWARELGLTSNQYRISQPEEIVEAIKIQLQGQRHRVDLGQVGEHYFLLWAGVGLDAYVIDQIEPRSKLVKRFGALSYIFLVLWHTRRWRARPVSIDNGHHQINGDFSLIIISNIQLYGGNLVFLDAEASITDGELSVWAMPGRNFFETSYRIGQFIFGQHVKDPAIKQLRGSQITITGQQALPMHCDAEPTGSQTEIVIRAIPRALTILVPAGREIPVLGK